MVLILWVLDFILIQSHLNMLQLTHQPPPSLQHTLATRLESALQNMHTPRPAPESEPLPNVFDPSWLLFDQNSMMTLGEGAGDSNRTSSHETSEVATGTGNPSTMIIFSAGNGSADLRMGPRVSHNYHDGIQEDESGQWLSNEQYTDAWQNTLSRLFGNSEMPTDGNELGI